MNYLFQIETRTQVDEILETQKKFNLKTKLNNAADLKSSFK